MGNYFVIHNFFQLILKCFIQLGKISAGETEKHIFPPTLTATESFCNMIQSNGKSDIKFCESRILKDGTY